MPEQKEGRAAGVQEAGLSAPLSSLQSVMIQHHRGTRVP